MRRNVITIILMVSILTLLVGCNKEQIFENNGVVVKKDNIENEAKEEEITYNRFNTYVKWNTIDENKKVMCLLDENDDILLQADYIITDDVSSSRFLRFINNNKIGYANAASGEVIVKPKFSEASILEHETAVVKENDTYYYIDSTGKRLSKNKYLEAFSFAESQGLFARVQVKKNEWQLINKEEILLTAKKINELPITETVTGVDTKGNAFALFIEHNYIDKDDLKNAIKTYEQFDDIESPFMGECAVVRDKKTHLKGAINFSNENYVLVETKYEDITIEKAFLDDEECLVFRCIKTNGDIDVIVK